MVRIGTPINKPTPRSIVTSLASPLLLHPPLRPFRFSRCRFSSFFAAPSARRRFSFLSFRPLFYHVQGKPINHRIPPVYCGTPGCRLEPATSLAFLYSASRLSRRSYFRKLPARGYVARSLASCETGARGKSNGKRKVKRHGRPWCLPVAVRKVCARQVDDNYYFIYVLSMERFR